MTTPADSSTSLLLATLQSLERGEPLSPANHRWLAAGLRAWIDGGATLEKTLGLERVDRDAWMRWRRDQLLDRAAALLDPDETMSDWRRAEALSRELWTFRTQIWPSWRELDAPPIECSQLRACLFAAFRISGGRVPMSAKSLARQRTSEASHLSVDASPDSPQSACALEDSDSPGDHRNVC